MPVYIDGSETVTVNDGVLSPNFGRKNAIINGNFDIWQRGTSTASSSAYLADRWKYQNTVAGGSSTTTATDRNAFALGQTDVPNNPKYYTSFSGGINGGSGTESSLYLQRIENVLTLNGQTATLSFYAKAASSKTINVDLRQGFGTGGSPSSSVYLNIGEVVLTTSWQKFEFTFNVPSISGKTLGTNGDDLLEIAFVNQAGAGSSYTTTAQNLSVVDIAQVQLEKGSVATDFEYRPIGEELALCQRYYWDCPLRIPAFPRRNSTTILSRAASVLFPVTMRATPTISYTSNASFTGTGLLASSEHGFLVGGAASSAGDFTFITGTKADAEL